MTPECAKHFTDSLQRELGGTFDAAKLRTLWPEMKKETDSAMAGAYDFILSRGMKLPTEEKLLQIVQVEGRKLAMAEAKQREEDHERQKPKRHESTFLTQEQKTEYSKRSALIMAMATPRNDQGMPIPVDRKRLEGLVEACEHMEACYPHVAEDWRGLKNYFVKKGLG